MKKTLTFALFVLLLAALAAIGPDTTAQDPNPGMGELEDFVPTEKVPAESSVSFPVDI